MAEKIAKDLNRQQIASVTAIPANGVAQKLETFFKLSFGVFLIAIVMNMGWPTTAKANGVCGMRRGSLVSGVGTLRRRNSKDERALVRQVRAIPCLAGVPAGPRYRTQENFTLAGLHRPMGHDLSEGSVQLACRDMIVAREDSFDSEMMIC